MFYKCTQSLIKSTLEQMLVTVMLRVAAQQVRSDKKLQLWAVVTQPKATPLQCMCVYREGSRRGFYLSKGKQLNKGSHKHQSCCMGEG